MYVADLNRVNGSDAKPHFLVAACSSTVEFARVLFERVRPRSPCRSLCKEADEGDAGDAGVSTISMMPRQS
jgi:hypothetical protein